MPKSYSVWSWLVGLLAVYLASSRIDWGTVDKTQAIVELVTTGAGGMLVGFGIAYGVWRSRGKKRASQ